MNGRLYDPVLHRFLQPDNYIQDTFNTQNFNRYGYVLNNPLLYTDPSGEEFVVTFTAGVLIGGVLASIGGMSAENWRDIKNWVGNVGKSIGNWFERQFNSVSSWFKVDSSPQVIGQYPIQRSQYNYPIVPYRNDIWQIQLPTQHHFLGINMTALSQGNMLQQMAYHTINDLYTIPQMLMLRRVGDSSNPMINLNGTSKTTEEGVWGFANSGMLGYSYLFKGVNVAKTGIKLSETKLLNQYNSVESLMQHTNLKKMQGFKQGFIEGDINSIFKVLTQNAKQIGNNRFQLKDGTIIMKYNSSSTGASTIHINHSGKIYKIRF